MMRRFNYSKIVKQVNRGTMSPRQFIEALYGPGFEWDEAWAACRLYLENGGILPPGKFFEGIVELDDAPKEVSFEDFLKEDIEE